MSTKKVLLVDSKTKYRVKLIAKVMITHNTRRFRFALPEKDMMLGLPTGSHVFLSATVDDQPCSRPYTPVSSDKDKGFMDFVIKVYFKDVNPAFPAGGKMTQYLDSLGIGDYVDIRGPLGNFEYRGCGECAVRESRDSEPDVVTVHRIGLIAGGTGITPILQVVRHVIKQADDSTELWVVFANRSERDILLRDELDEYADRYPQRIHVWYTVNESEPGWQYSNGHVDEKMLREHLPPPADDTFTLLCGPPAMISDCVQFLDALNYSEERRFVF